MSHLVDRRDYCREQIVKLISAVWLAEIVSALTIPWIPAEARRGGIRRRSKGAARVDARFFDEFLTRIGLNAEAISATVRRRHTSF